MFQGKKIILCVHEYADFSAMIKDGLESLGMTVIQLNTDQREFRYKNLGQRITNFFHKIISRNSNYKHKLKQNAIEQKLLKQLEEHDFVDYALIIRADILPRSVIEKIRQKSKTMIGYQWDGLNRFPSIYECIPLFDRFFVFDSQDLITPNTFSITNFYFDHIKVPKENNNKIFFAGSYFEKRNNTLKQIYSLLKKEGFVVSINIFCKRPKQISKIKNLEFKHLATVIDYKNYLTNILSSKILLDVQIDEHKGLSFRIFESLGYDKKIITSNIEVIKYDFYHPNNILVWENQSAEEINRFIALPYQQLPPNIKNKYSFSNWFAYVSDQKPYELISLPA